MTALTVDELQNFIGKLPGDYIVEFKDQDNISHMVIDKLEIDLSGKKLILKS